MERLPNCSIPSEDDDVGRGKEIEDISRGVTGVIEYGMEGVSREKRTRRQRGTVTRIVGPSRVRALSELGTKGVSWNEDVRQTVGVEIARGRW